MPGLLTAGELSRDRIERLIAGAAAHRAGTGRRHPGSIVGLAFFQESLRTRIGFEAAALRLDARATVIPGPKHSAAMWSPETLEDSIRSVAGWCDAICLRHADADWPQRLEPLVGTPIVNCGNGRDEHPAQALVDAFALEQTMGRIDGLRIALVGDLHGMRSAHSLVLALARFTALTLRCISPDGLELPKRFGDELVAGGHRVEHAHELDVSGVDAVYVAGLPAETRAGVLSAERQAAYRITPAVVRGMAPDARILCPLPRVDEIDRAVDELPQAAYFLQSQLGLAMRMAILDEALGGRAEGYSDPGSTAAPESTALPE